MISIQSLMSQNPYENEPGFEDSKSDYDRRNQASYIAKVGWHLRLHVPSAQEAQIRHETIRVSVVQRLENYLGIGNEEPPEVAIYEAVPDCQSNGTEASFEPFKDLCKRRFLWYFDSYLLCIEREAPQHKDGAQFIKMPFEGPGNAMEGLYQYSSLKARLQTIYDRLTEEMYAWAEEGRLAVEQELGIACNLQRQFEQIVEDSKSNDSATLVLELVDKNPFVWQLVLFGKPMTNLDGGVFRIKIFINSKFPDVLPRVKCETSIFHHRVSKDGIVCYSPARQDDLKSHIEAIIGTIEEDCPAYDPRTLVNPEAAKLLWGTPDEKKMYNRRLRRSVQESTEYAPPPMQAWRRRLTSETSGADPTDPVQTPQTHGDSGRRRNAVTTMTSFEQRFLSVITP